MTASTSGIVRASLGWEPWEKTRRRGTFLWSPSEFEFQEDTPGLDDVRDQESLSDVSLFLGGLEGVRHFRSSDARFRPYAVAGVVLGVWSLDDEEGTGPIRQVAGEDDPFTVGATGGIGVEVRATDALGVQLEFTMARLSSPFDETDGFVVTSGSTFDEPERVAVRNLTLGLSWTFD